MLSPECRELMLAKVLESVKKHLDEWDARRSVLEPALKEISGRISRLVQLAEDGAGDVREIAGKIRELQRQREAMEEELRALKPRVEVTREMVLQYFDRCAAEVLEEPQSLRKLASEYIYRVDVTNDEVRTYLVVRAVKPSGGLPTPCRHR